ncbi:TPA: phage tail tape measure protein [Clostridium botulinum]|nr:phage tail tape measure protein [Clostridium botulinum]HBZ7129997.1 phage tail tape measure protein [Clostridium botulinum]HBZ7133624.1 phage tail tape measure protein [Clostridium botulinum]
MADGTVVIDTELDNSGIEKGWKEANTSAKAQAAKLAAEYKKQGMSASEAFKKAWSEIERDSKEKSNKTSDNWSSCSDKLKGIASEAAKIVATSIAGIGTTLGGIGAYAIKVGSDFEAGMSKVKAISGATASDMELLSAKAKEMGASTKFSATESAEAMQYMAMAGWKTEQMIDGIGGIMNLAAADGLDLATTSDIVTDALTAFGLQAKDSTHFADVLAQASSTANTNVSMLGESFKYVAPVCGSMGYTAEDTSIALGIMANSGIKASQAGMTLKNAIVNMASPTSNMQKIMDQYHLSLTNTDGSMKSLKEVMDMLRDKMGGLDQATQAAAASTLFGKESMAGMLAVINASDSDFDKLTDAINNADGAAQQMADTMNDNLQGKITLLKSALEGVGIALYDKFKEPLKDAIDTAADSMSSLVESISGGDLSGSIDKIADGFSKLIINVSDFAANALPTVLEGFAWLLDNSNTIATGIVGIGTAMLTLNVANMINGVVKAFQAARVAEEGLTVAQWLLNAAMDANPIGIVISIIAGLVAAIIYLWNTNEGFRNAIIGAWTAICDAASSIWGSICSFFTETIPAALNACIDFISSNWQNLLLLLVNQFAGAFALLYSNCDGFREFIDQFVQSVCDFFTETIPEALQSTGEWFSQLPNMIAYGLGAAVGAIAEWCVECYDYLSTNIPVWIDSIGTWFSNLPDAISTWLSQTISDIGTWGSNMLNTAINWVSNIISSIGNWFSQLPSSISNGLSSALNALINWGSNMLSSAVSACKEIVDGIVNAFIDLPSKMVEIGKNIVLGIKDGIKNAWDSMTGWIGGLCTSFVDGVKSQFDIHSPSRVMRDQVGKWIPLGIAEGLKATTGNLLDTATDICKQLSNTFTSELNANTAQRYIDTISNWGGSFAVLAEELQNAKDAVEISNAKSIDDNIWYRDAKYRLEDVKSKLEELSETISDTEDKSTKESLQTQQKALQKQQKIIKKEVDYYKEAAQEEIDVCKENAKQQLNIAKEKQSKLEQLIKGVTTALKEQLNQQKEATINAIEAEMDAEEKRYNKKIANIEKSTKRKVEAVQKEIAALDEEKESESRLKEIQESKNNIAVLEAKMANTKSEADKKAYALKIKNAKAELSNKQSDWDREDAKKELQERIDDLNVKADTKKQHLKEDYEETKKHYEKQKKAAENYYKTLLDTDNLNAQARYVLLTNSNEQLVQLLNSYAPNWQNAGQSLADSLINGLNSKKQDMANAVQELTSLRSKQVSGYATGTSYNRLAGTYTVDEKGFELSTNNNPVAYVSKGAGILNHMQSLKAIKDEVSSQVANQMSILRNIVQGQQQQMYALAGAMAGVVNNSSSIREGDINFNVDKYYNNTKSDIKETAEELGFYAQRKKRC